MVLKRRSAPLCWALAKSKLVALRLMATGYLGTLPITFAPVAVVSRVMTFDIAPIDTDPPPPPPAPPPPLGPPPPPGPRPPPPPPPPGCPRLPRRSRPRYRPCRSCRPCPSCRRCQ